MQCLEIETDADGYERSAHGPAAFPLLAYDNDYSQYPTHSVPWHWHEECELVYVAEGSMVYRAAETRFTLRRGQGIFVNSNELHAVDPDPDMPGCRADSIVFDPSIVGGTPYSVFQLKYVAPIYKNPCIRAVPFTGKEPWHGEVLEALSQIRPTFDTESLGREMRLRTLLGQVWLVMLEHVVAETPMLQPAADPHICTMMLYIHNHYAEPLTLKDIADSANVSERTCNRSFRKELGMSVFSYLTSHRVKEAAQLLATTRDSITSICFATGFTDTAYFSRVFHSATGQSPSAFRKHATRESQKDPGGPSGRIAEG